MPLKAGYGKVEVRGDPHEVFRPREGGLTRIRCFRVVVVVVVVVGSKIGKNRQKSIMSRMIQNDLK